MQTIPYSKTGVTAEVYQRLDKSDFQEPPELQSHIDMDKLVQKVFPRQGDIDKILKIIQKKRSEGNAFTCYCKRNACRIANQPIF